MSEHVPKVSVLMCVFNGERYLREAIDSILGQTFTDFEFVIVDDGSGPAAKEILASYTDARIRLVTNPGNLGLTGSLNRGLAVCRGEYVARMDADDISHPERLIKQTKFMDEHRDIAVLGTQVRYINDNGNIIRASAAQKGTTPVSTRWQYLFDSPVAHSASMFHRDIILEEFGGYDERFVTSQDFELWSRVMRRYQIANLDTELVDFRCHAESVSRKYSPDYVKKIGAVFQQNLDVTIGSEPQFSDFGINWVTITNPGVLPPLADYSKVIKQLEHIYSKFRERHEIRPGSKLDREIRTHLADKFYLICYNASDYDRIAAIKSTMRFFEYNGLRCSLKLPALVLMSFVGRKRINKMRSGKIR